MSLRGFVNSPQVLPIYEKILKVFSEIKWPGLRALFNRGLYYSLKEVDHDKLRSLLKDGYYIILTRRKCHFTTYVIALTSYFTTGTRSHWTHALMNVEGDVATHMEHRLVEAIGRGVQVSTFMEVFDCDSVALLKPKGVGLDEWNKVMDKVISKIGTPYDLEFDISDDSKNSCVELVYHGLQQLPDFDTRFVDLIKLIKTSKNNLTPQMLYACGDLELICEIRR